MRLAAEPPPRGTTATINSLARLTQGSPRPNMGGRGMEQRQLVGLITRRSEVRILPPQPKTFPEPRPRPAGVLSCPLFPAERPGRQAGPDDAPTGKDCQRAEWIGCGRAQPDP